MTLTPNYFLFPSHFETLNFESLSSSIQSISPTWTHILNVQITIRNLHASGVPSKIPLIPHEPPRFIRLCKLAAVQSRYLEKGIWFSVCSSIPWNRRRNAQRGCVDWPLAIARISNQDGDDVTERARTRVGGGKRRSAFLYSYSQSRWRAQSQAYVSTRDIKWAIRRETYTGYTELCDSVELSVVALRYRSDFHLSEFFFLSQVHCIFARL